MKHLFRLTLATGLLLAAGTAIAANDTPVGTWKTIDDATHQAKSIVQITDSNGQLQGKILKLLNRTPEAIAKNGEHPLCTKCSGERKDQPIEGLTIMWGVTKDGNVWDDGKILDPKSGKVYKVKLTVIDGGQKLDVHGYIGFSLFGRSQVWERQP